MFKLIVLCAFAAATVAEVEPSVLFHGALVQPYASYSTAVSPALTSISSQSSRVIHPSPITYTTPLIYSHFTKKRSPQVFSPALDGELAGLGELAGYNPASSYIEPTAPVVQAPVTYSSAHLIKKRAAQFIPASYFNPTTYVSSSAFTTPVVSTPYIQPPYYTNAGFPLFNTHLIKKRSTPFLPTTYITPSNYINTPTPYLALASPFASNIVYSGHATHLIKKRSADPQPEPQIQYDI